MRFLILGFAIIAVIAAAAINKPVGLSSVDITNIYARNITASGLLNDDSYRYNVLKRSEFAQDENEEATSKALAKFKTIEEPELSGVLGETGYKYKTVHRDVSDIVNEYWPPIENVSGEIVAEVESLKQPEKATVSANEYLTLIAEDNKGAIKQPGLGENGYEYKTVRRLKYRQRRDVADIESEYLPPAEKVVGDIRTTKESDKFNDVANNYLPPNKKVTVNEIAEVNSTEEPNKSSVLAENGYEYKSVRHLKYRQRRDVLDIVNNYLPPAEEAVAKANTAEGSDQPTVLANIYLHPTKQDNAENAAKVKLAEEPNNSAALGENGYEYKTIRRLTYRQRRDVSEIANEYLPPAEESVAKVKTADKSLNTKYLPPTEQANMTAMVKLTGEPQESVILGEDGYEYKTVRYLKYHQGSDDVSEIPNEYLPPANIEAISEVKVVEEPDQSNALLNEYLPPKEKATNKADTELNSKEEPEDSDILGENGYEYKTIRHLKYRIRRL